MNTDIMVAQSNGKVKRIYEHPNEIFSVYLSGGNNVKWILGKNELVRYISEISKEKH